MKPKVLHVNFARDPDVLMIPQDSHRFDKYLNIQDCLEKYLKNTQSLEKSLNFTVCKRIQCCLLKALISIKLWCLYLV